MVKISIILFISLLLVLQLGCDKSEERHSFEDEKIRGDEIKAINECRQVNDGDIIYKTAAKFSMAVPITMTNHLPMNWYNQDCELVSMHFYFAWTGQELLIMPKAGTEEYDDIKVKLEGKENENISSSESYMPLSLMLQFSSPWDGYGNYDKEHCKNKNPVYHYPEYNIVMCPSVMGVEKSPNMTTFPFYPRFEISDNREFVTSFSCAHKYFDGYTVENVHEVEVEFCRGSWLWRSGAGGLFDFQGKIIQNAASAMGAAEEMLDSWVVK